MKLKTLLSDVALLTSSGSTDMEIHAVSADSKAAGPGTLFVAVRGTRADGHDYLEDAYRAGARAFLSERSFVRPGCFSATVGNSRHALARCAGAFYGNPSDGMTLVGITGTNGKTTVAFLLESILQHAGRTAGVVTTVTYRCGSYSRPARHTTPDAVTVQKLLREMLTSKADCAVMEVSSHGLDQRRVEGCSFDVGIFTNLTPEHLDYHATMEHYFESKQRFFTELLPASRKPDPVAVVNSDSTWGRSIIQHTPCRVLTYGMEQGDIHTRSRSLSLQTTEADIVTPRGTIGIRTPLVGAFNLYNILAAAAAAEALGVHHDTIRSGIDAVTGVPGRMERIESSRDITVIVDYAHTGDALQNVLQTISGLGASGIITVFGCGGDRDSSKRPVMGRIAARYSRCVVLTNDNPRSEEPLRIIAQIEQGLHEAGFKKIDAANPAQSHEGVYMICCDRQIAIRLGIGSARPGEVVLIAGKGHETYQQTSTDCKHFDDREEARRALQLCA